MVATITLTPATGPVGMQKVVVNGAGWTSGNTIVIFTFGGATPPTNTVIGQVVSTAGTWSGSFTVPYSSAAGHTCTATDNNGAPVSANATFTTTTSALKDASGAAHGAASAATSVAATLSTTSSPDLLVAVVVWEDETAPPASVTLSDATGGAGLTWTPRGQPISYVTGASGSITSAFFIQEFTAYAPATITTKAVTATFSAATSGRSAISVCGFTDIASPMFADSNLGLPSPITGSATAATFTGKASTHYAPTLLFGALLLAPSAAITVGTGFTQVDAYNVTDFYIETECKVVVEPQVDALVTWTAASAAYIILGFVDAFLQSGATNAPWTTTDIGAEVQGVSIRAAVNSGLPVINSTETGVAKWEMPTVIANYPHQTVMNNRTDGLTGTTTTGTSSTVLHETAVTLVVNALVGYTLFYTSGTAQGQSRVVTANAAGTITVGVAFSPAPSDLGETFLVVPSLVESHTTNVQSVIGVGGETADWEGSQTTVAP